MNKSGLNTIWPKQIKPKEILPTMQLVAQPELELKHQQNEAPVFAPIKATPELESTHSTSVTAKGRTTTTTTKRKCKTKEQPKKKKKKTTQKKKRSFAHLRDIFN